jgi:protein-S-isoprenylcysteine O-methyltransferase Ste14
LSGALPVAPPNDAARTRRGTGLYPRGIRAFACLVQSHPGARVNTCMIPFPKSYADLAARLRVPCGFVLAISFAISSAPTPRSLAWGIPVACVGLALRAWAAGHLAKNQQLAVSGPYAHLRNPLYLGTLLVAAGLAIAARSWALAVLFAVFFVLIYLPVIMLEQQHLRKLFPAYADYAAQVPAFIPRLRAFATASTGSGFQVKLYRKNQEYKALIGFIAGVAWLAWKAFRNGF